jgi:hypothetical protein
MRAPPATSSKTLIASDNISAKSRTNRAAFAGRQSTTTPSAGALPRLMLTVAPRKISQANR